MGITQEQPERLIHRIARELNAVGLTTRVNEKAQGFLGHVDIVKGELEYRETAKPSDLLHEAGHLACLPPKLRAIANTDLSSVTDIMEDEIKDRLEKTGDAEDPYIRAIMQCSDTEATAWAWAMGKRLNMEPEEIISDGDYEGEVEGLRLGLSVNSYFGINGLRAAGMIESTRNYPRLSKWLQDAE